MVGGYVGIGAAANTSNALLVTGDINYTGTLRQNGTAVTFSSPGINSTGNIGINSASNTSNALLVTGSQSNTGALFIGGLATFVNSSNTGTLGVAGLATFVNSSNTGTLGVAGLATFVNSSNTGTLGIAGLTTHSSNLGLFTNSFAAQFEIRGGANNLGNLGSNLISFQYGPDGGYRHFITSRHNGLVNVNTNSIDFWLNNTTTAGGSSTSGTGNVNTMSITAAGVGVNCNAPGYMLDVNGSANINTTLRVVGLTTLVNSSNTGTLGVAGTATFSGNLNNSGQFTNGRFQIFPATTNNYTIMGLGGGNTIGYMYGDFQLLGDGIHMGYNYYSSNGVAYSPSVFGNGCTRITMGYNDISLNLGTTANLSTIVNVGRTRVTIAPITTDYGLFAPTPTFVSSIAFNSTYNDLINGAPWYGIGKVTSGLAGLGPYTVAATQWPLQIANYYGLNFVGGTNSSPAGASHMAIVDGKVGIQNPAPSYTLDVNGPMQAAVYYSTISSGGTLTVTPNNFGIFYNITTAGTYTLAFAATQASSNIGKYVCVRNNSGSTLSFTLTGVSGIASPVTLSNAQSATFVVATTTTYALF